VTGGIDPFSKFDMAETLVGITSIYWWYYADKDQRNFRTGIVQNVGVILFAIVALPIYFIRSRGWKGGGIATLGAAGVLAAIVALEYVGEAIGTAIVS
jgi:hypothetical protein